MRIGIDFDNTIAAYDDVFLAAAKQWRLLSGDSYSGKKQIRDTIRSLSGGEHQWQRLQGYVYGKGMKGARLYPGIQDFLLHCKHNEYPVYIISHKTQYAHFDEDHTDLRMAAWAWMDAQDFFTKTGYGIDPDHVFFSDTRNEKLIKVKQANCDVFIDDLVEIFLDPDFPSNVKKILFDPNKTALQRNEIIVVNNWDDIRIELF